MSSGGRWLATLWPIVRAPCLRRRHVLSILAAAPLGGFVPFLLSRGYDAVGVDPKAPDTPHVCSRISDGATRPVTRVRETPQRKRKTPPERGLRMVGGTGLEPVTPSLSSWCSPN